jgi:hypothetical protein
MFSILLTFNTLKILTFAFLCKYFFKIINRTQVKIGRGAICVFVGEFQDSYGNLEIRIHKAFKVMFSILMLMPIAGFIIAVFTNGFQSSIGILIPMFMGILFVRFVFMELSFRFISETGLNKLNRLIGLKVK